MQIWQPPTSGSPGVRRLTAPHRELLIGEMRRDNESGQAPSGELIGRATRNSSSSYL
uniref:Uncharacterized protein n=1 Tax=Anguilla anguilla TaxID=7936 RepID=A0A0E9PBT3_ANGAN